MNNQILNDEMSAAMAQGAEPAGLNVPQMGATPPIQPNYGAPQQMGMQPQVDMDAEINQARELLGINALEADRDYRDNLAEAISNNQGVTKDAIEKEIANIEANSPEFAKQIRLSKDGLDMIAKKIIGEVKPNTQPDNITDEAGNNVEGEDDLTGKVKSGKANKLELGKYLGQI